MTDEQLRLDADVIAVLRASVSHAIECGAQFVAPPHLLLALLADPLVGPAIAPLVARGKVDEAANGAALAPPRAADVPGAPLGGGDEPFVRYDSLAFRSTDGARTLYLDAEAYRLFIEGARRAVGAFRAKHLVYGFAAEAIKDRALLGLFSADPQGLNKAVEAL